MSVRKSTCTFETISNCASKRTLASRRTGRSYGALPWPRVRTVDRSSMGAFRDT